MASQRNLEVLAQRESGMTLAEIAVENQISVTRVCAILDAFDPEKQREEAILRLQLSRRKLEKKLAVIDAKLVVLQPPPLLATTTPEQPAPAAPAAPVKDKAYWAGVVAEYTDEEMRERSDYLMGRLPLHKAKKTPEQAAESWELGAILIREGVQPAAGPSTMTDDEAAAIVKSLG